MDPVVNETRSTCPYCGVGCGVIIQTHQHVITGVRGDPQHPANLGKLCTKGSTLHLTARPSLQTQVRARVPQLRRRREETLNTVTWDTALSYVAEKFSDCIEQHGPDSVAFYISGQLLTEDYYVFNKLAKGLIGTNNIDTNSRLCMSSAVAGYKQTLGADAPPCCYEDIDQADVIFIAGSNTAFAHPILFRRIEQAKLNNPDLKLIVADPRYTDTAQMADLHLPLLPGTDVALFHGLLHIMLWEGLIDEDYIKNHTEGFSALKTLVRDYTPAYVAELCGIRESDLVQTALWFGRARSALSLYCQGLNQSSSGTAKNASLINLHLATGQIGRPGAGPFSLTGQPNAMGGREVGGMANLLSAHRDLSNAQHRAEVARLWGVPEVPDQPGKTAVEMFDALERGDIKMIWIACTNPAHSMPDQGRIRAALERADLVVVQDAYSTTATVAYADVVLPATSWGEKDGTVTNSERRISRVRPAISAPGQARHDWKIVVDFAHQLEMRWNKNESLFPYQKPEDIWNEHRETTRGRDLDITGLSYARLEREGPQQWPFASGSLSGKKRLYADGVFATDNGRAKFFIQAYRPVAEEVDARYPFRLNTGRLRDQWHGMSRTATVGRLFSHVAEPYIEMNTEDMQRRQWKEDDYVYVTSRRGSQLLPVRSSRELRSGQAFLAMHWGSEFIGGHESTAYGVNAVTLPAYDPLSKQPELKHAAVKLVKAHLPWRLVAFAWVPDTEQWRLHQALRSLFPHFSVASATPFGRDEDDQTGLLFRAAAEIPANQQIIVRLEHILGLDSADMLCYDDSRRAVRRRIRLQNGKLSAVLLVGDVQAEHWLRDYLQARESVEKLGRWLLAPGTHPPQGFAARGRVVCSCFNVAEKRIEQSIAAAENEATAVEILAHLQQDLKCGTSCGSCLPELRRMIKIKCERQ